MASSKRARTLWCLKVKRGLRDAFENCRWKTNETVQIAKERCTHLMTPHYSALASNYSLIRFINSFFLSTVLILFESSVWWANCALALENLSQFHLITSSLLLVCTIVISIDASHFYKIAYIAHLIHSLSASFHRHCRVLRCIGPLQI